MLCILGYDDLDRSDAIEGSRVSKPESPSPSLQARLHRSRSGPAVTGRRLTLISPERHLK